MRTSATTWRSRNPTPSTTTTAAATMRIDRDMDERDLKGPTPQGLHVSKTKRWYLRCVASVDDNVGRLLDYLDAEGLTEATPVVYTSDKGFFWAITAGSTNASFEDDIILNVDFAPILEGCTPPDWRSAMYYPGTLDELQDPECKLFDLHNDPYELDNLADEPEKAELLAGLKAELERAQVEVGDTPYVRV
ncbi:putative sulfatase [Colletotrichum asianum]|uniref:Putative sulfatase n=1 Tax=Colletotrichum asianum TaxID=702518 RepID=A0A8H3VVP5_9PEZI|nr:putative sulfatase [Colletotrichum asianum]